VPVPLNVTYRPLAGRSRPLLALGALLLAAFAVGVGLGVVALVGGHHDPRDGRALIAIVVLGLIAAYLYLVRIAYRLDLHDGYIEIRSVLPGLDR